MLLQEEYPIARELNEKLYEIMVDEYQDTNMVQETIISLISKATEHEVPCFMVGDMKQSIYRFRQADPEIFKNKYDTYPSLTGTKRIDLGFNYRSSKVVLDSINYIFNQIMDEHIGSLEYYRDRSAQLNYDFLRKEGAKDTSLFEEVKQKALNRYFNLQDDTTEVLMVNTSSEKPKDIEDGEYEAWMIGQRILELKGKGLDGKAISYQDIAVLMRQTTKFMTYKKVFDKLNIPTTIVLSSGFMNAVEIRQIVMVLKCLVNPYDDLALMSVLRAPFSFSYFKENEIIAIRHKEYSLYENICGSNKFTSFVNVLEELRALFKKLPFSQWLQCFYEVSGYLNRVAVMKNGVQRYQNLLLLLEKVKEQETEIHDLQSWIDYFEILKESDAAPAVMPKDQEAVVFMTIHKSKGLEFPVVFVAMHDKAFNLRDSKERIIFDRHLTMAIKPRLLRSYETKIFDEPMTYKDVIVEYDNPFLSLLSVNANQETISEEMRVYYVALTRAKSKLILTGCLSEEELNGYVDALIVNQRGNVPEKDEWILNRKIRDGRSYLDWLMPSILVHPKIAPKISEDIRPLQPSLDNTNLAKFSFEWKNYNDIPTETIINDAEIGQGETLLLFDTKDYAYERDVQSSIAVTTLGKENKSQVHYSVAPSLPQVMSAADKGTLVHEFMEYLPLENDINVVDVIETLYNEGRYSDTEYQVLLEYKEKLENFISSKAFKFMKEAKMCLREQPFALMQDKQLIHGTFDVLCMNDDVIQVIDYKTDRVSLYSKNEDLVKRHEFQLNLYKQALQTMYPNLQIQTYLYYLEIGRFVEV